MNPVTIKKIIDDREPENCRSCVSFKHWAKQQRQQIATTTNKTDDNKKTETPNNSTGQDKGCPLDKDELGRSTWGFLHTLAAHYPEKPSERQQTEVKQFFGLISKFYPCEYCAKDMQTEIKKDPPVTDSQEQLSQWLCQFHNKVNKKLGKAEFDCSKVNERWRDGWLDGSCD